MKIFAAGVAHKPHLMAQFLTPHPDDLRHNARQILIHHPGIEGICGTFGDQVQYCHPTWAHAQPPKMGYLKFWVGGKAESPEASLP